MTDEERTYPAVWPGADRYADDPSAAPLALLVMPPADPHGSLVGDFIADDASNASDIASDNILRAVWAAQAVRRYSEFVYYGSAQMEEPIQQTLADLLSDMRHLCDALGLDYLSLAASSASYDAELRGQF